MIDNKEALKMYKSMMDVFSINEADFYDVDMFTGDITRELFTETDPQDIDEDDFLIFQEALILLVRDDLLANRYGTQGLAIIHADLMNLGEHYYVNKEVTK